MSKQYDLVVFIGRCEPNHIGHNRNINEATKLSDKVLVILGSINKPRTPQNPFTFEERKGMIKSVFPGDNVVVDGVKDYDYQTPLWTENVHRIVKQHTNPDAKIAILGYEKDDSSFYLRLFPTWKFEDIGEYTQIGGQEINATKIRELYFEGHFSFLKGVVATTTHKFMLEFAETDDYQNLVKEYEFIQEYKKQWKDSPYPPTFMTVDAVVVQGTHVLLIKRKASPGAGLWALPGGFINQDETCMDAAMRELREETKLKVPPIVLEKSIVAERLFDSPTRSQRGRTLSQAYLFQLTAGDGKLPKVKGADDAMEAKWFSLDVVEEMSDQLYEDHYSIIHLLKSKLR
jgi:bifunctional NMN adenylyltransferase/nudix hydrolase